MKNFAFLLKAATNPKSSVASKTIQTSVS